MAEKPRIMIFDHYPAFLDLMQDLLAEEGYAVLPMMDGNAEYAIKMVQEQQPDLVMLDIVMQAHDVGMTSLALIRLNPKTRAIPVIVCSADGRFLKDKEANLKALGCCVLEKPFDLQQLLTTIQEALPLAA